MRKTSPNVVTTLLVSSSFGAAALAVVVAGLTLPIPGIDVVTDPRELFATIGAALTGPVGGVLIGVLAGIREPGNAPVSVVAHILGGLWLGLNYKRVLYEQLQMPFRLLAWALLVLTYYYLILVPGFAIGGSLFPPAGQTGPASPLAAYTTLARGALPEAVLTTIITTMAMAALPRRYRRPLW